jgi:hypothetical protein
MEKKEERKNEREEIKMASVKTAANQFGVLPVPTCASFSEREKNFKKQKKRKKT